MQVEIFWIFSYFQKVFFELLKADLRFQNFYSFVPWLGNLKRKKSTNLFICNERWFRRFKKSPAMIKPITFNGTFIADLKKNLLQNWMVGFQPGLEKFYLYNKFNLIKDLGPDSQHWQQTFVPLFILDTEINFKIQAIKRLLSIWWATTFAILKYKWKIKTIFKPIFRVRLIMKKESILK